MAIEDDFKVEEGSGNSILFTDVDADLGFPESSACLPKTATPQLLTIGVSQGSMAISSPSEKGSPGFSPRFSRSSLLEASRVPISSSLTLLWLELKLQVELFSM